MKIYLTSLFLLLFINSYSQRSKNKIITIDPYLSFQNYEHFKRLTLSSPDSNIEFLENFDFEWGYSYKISVRETKLREVLSDGTRYEYCFNKVISKTKMADSIEFKLFIDPNRYYYELDSSEQYMNYTLQAINDSTFLYFDTVEIEVPSTLTTQFDKIVSGEKKALGYFIYINGKRIKLVRI